MSQTFFCDTNLFLQCRSIKSLPWCELAGGEEAIFVYVPRTVQTELDTLKQDGNGRRAQRARDASSTIKEIIRSPDAHIGFKSKDTPVVLRLSGLRSPSAPRHPELDLTRNDDRIIDEALAWSHTHNERVSILTHDTGVMASARHCKLPFVEVPDGWLLEPEPDGRDKKIAELERIVKAFQTTQPEIQSSYSRDSEPVDNILHHVLLFPDLTPVQVEANLQRVQRAHPEVANFERPRPTAHDSALSAITVAKEWLPPSSEAIRTYHDEQYPEWLEKLRVFFLGVNKKIEAAARVFLIQVTIANTGSRPAEATRIQLLAHGGLKLLPEDTKLKDQFTRVDLPKPPKAPAGRWVNRMFSALEGLNDWNNLGAGPLLTKGLSHLLHPPEPRDPEALYWRHGKSGISDRWELSCEMFMHKVKPVSFTLPLLVPIDVTLSACALELLVTASNLREPHKHILPIRVTYGEGDTIQSVEQLTSGKLFR